MLRQFKGASAITLVYGASDNEHNQAVVLRDVLERALSGGQKGE
jgi:uncharacterized protein YeaO (DUF488 family)